MPTHAESLVAAMDAGRTALLAASVAALKREMAEAEAKAKADAPPPDAAPPPNGRRSP